MFPNTQIFLSSIAFKSRSKWFQTFSCLTIKAGVPQDSLFLHLPRCASEFYHILHNSCRKKTIHQNCCCNFSGTEKVKALERVFRRTNLKQIKIHWQPLFSSSSFWEVIKNNGLSEWNCNINRLDYLWSFRSPVLYVTSERCSFMFST